MTPFWRDRNHGRKWGDAYVERRHSRAPQLRLEQLVFPMEMFISEVGELHTPPREVMH